MKALETTSIPFSEEPATIPGRDLLDLFAFYRNSFQHSQGNVPLQDGIFVWARNQGMLDRFTIPYEIPGYINEHLKPPSAHKTLSHQSMTAFSKGLPWHHLHTIANNGETPFIKGGKERKEFDKLRSIIDPNDLLIIIIKGIARRDLDFQGKQRLGRTNPTEDDGPLDPHASLLRYYAILGHSPGNPIFQEFYDQIKQTISRYRTTSFPLINIKERRRQSDLLKSLGELAQAWSLNHPGQQFFPRSP